MAWLFERSHCNFSGFTYNDIIYQTKMFLEDMIMIIKRLYFIATVLFAFSVCSCGGENYPDHPWEWDQDTEEEDPNPDGRLSIISANFPIIFKYTNLQRI